MLKQQIVRSILKSFNDVDNDDDDGVTKNIEFR